MVHQIRGWRASARHDTDIHDRKAHAAQAVKQWMGRVVGGQHSEACAIALSVWLEHYAVSCDLQASRVRALCSLSGTMIGLIMGAIREMIRDWKQKTTHDVWWESSIHFSNSMVRRVAVGQLVQWGVRAARAKLKGFVRIWRMATEDELWAVQMLEVETARESETSRSLFIIQCCIVLAELFDV